jgi:hypothetical protein
MKPQRDLPSVVLWAARRARFAGLLGAWRHLVNDPAHDGGGRLADVVLLPLAGLTLSLYLLGTVPAASEAIAVTLSSAGLH